MIGRRSRTVRWKIFLGAALLAGFATGPLHAQPASEVVAVGVPPREWQSISRMLRDYALTLEPPVSAITANDAAYYLRLILLERGFADAEVNYHFEGNRLVFEVYEGGRQFVGNMVVEGAPALTREHSRAIIENAMRQDTLTPIGPIPFARSAVQLASDRLVEALALDGYLSAMGSVVIEQRPRRTDVTFQITEGPRFFIRKIRLEGEVPEGLESKVSGDIGTPYQNGEEFVLATRLRDELRNRGFFDAVVTHQAQRSPDGEVDIVLGIQPGREFSLGSITVEGNRFVSQATILRRMGMRTGKPFDAGAFNQAVRRLWMTGAFDTITPEFEPAPAGTLDVRLKVEEAPTKQVQATVGYGQWDQAFARLNYTDRNFLGSLNRFSLDGFVSVRNYGIIASLADPALFATDLEGALQSFYIRRETPAYDATFYGGSLAVRRKFDLTHQTGWEAGLEWRETTDSNVFAGEDTEDAPQDYRFGAVSFGQSYDRRNDPLVPMQGFFVSWNSLLASEAFLGDVNMFQLRGQATWYIPLQRIEPTNPFVPFFVLNHRAGIILAFDSPESIPVQERFFLGGPDSVRSFQLDGMAPRDRDGNPLGGQFFLLGNAEFQMPVFRAVYLVAFLDAGNLASTPESFRWSETRVAAGLGARLYTPLGAVRIDYGYNLLRGDGDPIGAWQFGFGFTF